MKKEEYILQTAKEMFITIVSSDGCEWDDDAALEELAKTCAKCAEIIWKQASPLGF